MADDSEAATLRADLDATNESVCELRNAIVDIRGESGSDGKLGELTRKVDEMRSRRWWAYSTLIAALIAAVSSAIVMGRWVGQIETDVATLKARRSAPDASLMPAEPAKDK